MEAVPEVPTPDRLDALWRQFDWNSAMPERLAMFSPTVCRNLGVPHCVSLPWKDILPNCRIPPVVTLREFRAWIVKYSLDASSA